MELSNEEIINAILDNDTARVAEMLEEFDLIKDNVPYLTPSNKHLASTMLSFASAMSYRSDLDSGLAEELIERTAMTVNIFSFMRLVVTVEGIKTNDFDIIPEEIRTTLCKNDYTNKIAQAIEKLDDDAFAALLAFLLTGKIKCIHVKFGLSIIRHIYAKGKIPKSLIFAYMGLCQRETFGEHFGLNNAIGALGGLTLLDSLIDGIRGRYDDDDNAEG